MANLPILTATNPETIPAKTYDRVWIEEIIIRAPDPNGDILGEVKLRKYGMFDGVAEFEPRNGQWIRVENILEQSNSNETLQTAMSALITYVTQLAVSNDIVSVPEV